MHVETKQMELCMHVLRWKCENPADPIVMDREQEGSTYTETEDRETALR